MAHPEDEHAGHSPSFAHSRGPRSPFSDGSHSLRRSLHVTRNLSRLADLQSNAASFHDSSIQRLHQSVDSIEHAIASTAAPPTPFRSERHIPLYPTARSSLSGPRLATSQASARGESSARTFTESRAYRTLGSHQQLDPIYGASYNESEDVSVGLARREYVDSPNNDLARGMSLPSHYQNHGQHRLLQDRSRILGVYSPHTQRSRRPQHDAHELHDAEDQAFPWAEEVLTNQSTRVPTLMPHQTHLLTRRLPLLMSQQTSPAMISQSQHDRSDTSVPQQPATPAPPHYTHQQRYTPDQEQQPGHPRQQPQPHGAPQQHQRPAFLSQPVYQLACAACIRPLCLRAMKAVMLSDHSKELYSTDMPPAGLQLVNDDRQVRHCACRIRDSACLGCGQIAGYHVTQPCSDCLKDQNNGHFWMFYSSAVFHYKRHRIDGLAGGVMLWANVPPISYDQSLAQQLRLEVPILTVQTRLAQPRADADPQGSGDDRPLTACVEMEEWLTSPISEVVCR